VRQYILLFLLFVVLFFLPLQVFIVGDFTGIGVQGAVYRYQESGYGTASMLLPREINYVTSGIYTGRTALSIILWASGTILLACTTAYACIHTESPGQRFYRQIGFGLIGSCVIYLASCIAQYGFLFHGMAGFSFPVGIIMILSWIGIFYFFPGIFAAKSFHE
jgi:hypothetical protein